MQTITNPARESELIIIDSFYPSDHIVFFDIETTGFTAETTSLYMIGCAHYTDNKWCITQWFNDDGNSEVDILKAFYSFISSYKYIISYNGDGFDIPYLIKKYKKHNIPYDFSKIESIDLYKVIKPIKSLLHLDNLKQKSIELFLGVNRLDKYTGGDLITVYNDFLKGKIESNRQLLLQHNYEDLEGLLYCTSILSYLKFKAGCFYVSTMFVENNRLIFNLKLDFALPKRISFGQQDIIITANNNECSISVPIISSEFKFFFDDYKEYYYLPVEDMAIHKSVANYVDKNYRQQAKRETCYTKRQGHFIPQFTLNILCGYKLNYKDKLTYLELADSFLRDMDLLNSYARNIVNYII